MPQSKKKNTQPIKVKTFICAGCGNEKNSKEYYISCNPIHKTGIIPYCKECLRNMSCDEKGNINLDKFKNMLKMIDRPFLKQYWISSVEAKMDTLGAYFKNLQLLQNRKLTWLDSDKNIAEINYIRNDDFEVTDELYEKWGFGYKPEEYRFFEKKYNQLKNNYPEKTAMHTEALLNYIRYRVKEELATARGDVKEAKEWGQLAKDAATSAKINPSQLSAADLADGLSTFGQLVRAVEQAVDIIPILPHFKEKPQDKVDFTLWCYINYIRDLKGLPHCEYKDIWKFYDERKKEYENRFDFLQEKKEMIENEESEE